MLESWKQIKDLDYYISNYGRVKSLKEYRNGFKEYIMSVSKNKGGYCHVNLSINGKAQNKYIHRLVAEAFIPNPLSKATVNHKDGDKANNHVINLEWATRSENSKHAHSNGLMDNQITGAIKRLAKHTESEVLNIRNEWRLFDGKLTDFIRHKYPNSKYMTIWLIVNRRTWNHI